MVDALPRSSGPAAEVQLAPMQQNMPMEVGERYVKWQPRSYSGQWKMHWQERTST
jgi:hypothetical protein